MLVNSGPSNCCLTELISPDVFQDERFVFKQMSRFEIQSFLKFAPNYFNYISTAVTESKLTTLCKVSYCFLIIGRSSKLVLNNVDVSSAATFLFNVKQFKTNGTIILLYEFSGLRGISHRL